MGESALFTTFTSQHLSSIVLPFILNPDKIRTPKPRSKSVAGSPPPKISHNEF